MHLKAEHLITRKIGKSKSALKQLLHAIKLFTTITTDLFFSSLWLTVKLFTLMGGTWLMEFVSWALEYNGTLATICDSINILRGPIIFYLCVVGNAKVRKAIISRLLKPTTNRASQISRSTTQSDFASGAAISLTVMNADTAL